MFDDLSLDQLEALREAPVKLLSGEKPAEIRYGEIWRKYARCRQDRAARGLRGGRLWRFGFPGEGRHGASQPCRSHPAAPGDRSRVIGLKLGRTEASVRDKAKREHVSLKPANRIPYNRRKAEKK